MLIKKNNKSAALVPKCYDLTTLKYKFLKIGSHNYYK